MVNKSRAPIGLKTGLIAFGVIGAAFLGALSMTLRSASPIPNEPAPQSMSQVEQVLSDAGTASFLRHFDRVSPIRAKLFRDEASAAIKNGVDQSKVAEMLLRALLYEFRANALTLRNARVEDFDQVLAHLRVGFEALKASDAKWCRAVTVEALLKQSETDLIASLVGEFRYPGAGYDWALRWGELYLGAAETALRAPTRHQPRNNYDKLVLQQQGLNLGARQWTLALQIANFSQVEGQGHRPMRQIIEAIDVCELGIAIDDLSTSLPGEVRGRIWAELAPEIFYGNTPYVLYLVTDYFFLSE